MTIGDAADALTALAPARYALTPDDENSNGGSMNDINNIGFVAANYVGREVYTKTADNVYTYLGKVVYGSNLPEDMLSRALPYLPKILPKRQKIWKR